MFLHLPLCFPWRPNLPDWLKELWTPCSICVMMSTMHPNYLVGRQWVHGLVMVFSNSSQGNGDGFTHVWIGCMSEKGLNTADSNAWSEKQTDPPVCQWVLVLAQGLIQMKSLIVDPLHVGIGSLFQTDFPRICTSTKPFDKSIFSWSRTPCGWFNPHQDPRPCAFVNDPNLQGEKAIDLFWSE